MNILKAAITKEFKLLFRDKTGITLMFLMPILLALVMTILQNSAFKIINESKFNLLMSYHDADSVFYNNLQNRLERSGMFNVTLAKTDNVDQLSQMAMENDALIVLIFKNSFYQKLREQVMQRSAVSLKLFGLKDTILAESITDSTSMYIMFDPVLQEAYRYSIKARINAILMEHENELLLKQLYFDINQASPKEDDLKQLMPPQRTIAELNLNGMGKSNPNATQHNIPAWTLFAMFFTVISLGSNMVKEKLNGSFLRLKTMPISIYHILIAKQILFFIVTFIQAFVLFSIGKWVFPLLHLPALVLMSGMGKLLFVTFCCGFCSVSYSLCIGVWATTTEQSNGFGSASIVIMAALGGVFVPVFAMPQIFKFLSLISPFNWGLNSYYAVFIQNDSLLQIGTKVLPLLMLAIAFQLIAYIGLKRKNLI